MGMAERIKERRTAIGYTQEELAQKLGLQKSAIAKYENGRVENIKRSVIAKMAIVLETTPAYLMGWEQEEEYNTGKQDAILVKKFHRLNEVNKQAVLNIIDNLLQTQSDV